MTVYNIYCDESCHLEHDGHRAMVLGAVRCPAHRRGELFEALRDIKARHNLNRKFELKWTKASPAKLAYYLDVIDFFVVEDDLSFRAVVVPDKSKLRHQEFGQTHDEFYFKTYYQLLRHFVSGHDSHRIFLDIKDTRSWSKTQKLEEILASSLGDIDHKVIKSIKLARSEEVELIQLADLLTGCVSYANREPRLGSAKSKLVDQLERKTGVPLSHTTTLGERKINLLVWRAREAGA